MAQGFPIEKDAPLDKPSIDFQVVSHQKTTFGCFSLATV
jgi:hypothetical protein